MKTKFLVAGLMGPLCALPAAAQVVQLPVLRQFSVGTTVSVPTQGSTALGGVSYGRTRSVVRRVPVLGRVPGLGPAFANRVLRSQYTSSRATARVTIIDHAAWEAAVAERGAAVTTTIRSAPVDPLQEKARFLSQHVGRATGNPRLSNKTGEGRRPALLAVRPAP